MRLQLPLLAAFIGCLSLSSQAQARPVTAKSCASPAGWTQLDSAQPRPVAAAALISEMAQREVVLLGERHDDADHHRWQLQTLAALHAQRSDLRIGFEMFPRRVQPVLDRWVAGELTLQQFLEQSDWDKVWQMPAELYVPLFQFARINRIPMLALNIEQKLTRSLADKGWHAIPDADREGVGQPAAPLPAYRHYLREIHREHSRMRGKAAAEAPNSRAPGSFENFVDSQTVWDRAMAEALVRGRGKTEGGAKPPLLVGIMGSGHLRFGHGVPHQLRDLGVTRIGVLLPMPFDTPCRELGKGLADAVFTLPRPPGAMEIAAKPEPPRLGVLLEEAEGSVRVAGVTKGSLAESSGLLEGDRLLRVAGQPASKVAQVILQIRQQPAGTWLPVELQRGEETRELVIKFPVRP